MTVTIVLISLLVAAILGLVAYRITSRITLRLDRSGAARLAASEGEVAPIGQHSHERLGATVAQWTPKTYLKQLEQDHYWMAFVGDPLWGDKSVTYVLGRQVFYAVGLGMVFFLIFNKEWMFLVGAVLGWRNSVSNLKSRAKEYSQRITAELPEFVQLMAAEASSGASLDAVLTRVSDGTSFVSGWLKYVIQRSAGKSIVGDVGSMTEGSLMEEAVKSGHQDLIALAVQLSFVKSGIEVVPLLKQLAETFRENYVAKANIRSKALAVQLTMLSGVFYLIPYIFGLLIIVGIAMSSQLAF